MAPPEPGAPTTAWRCAGLGAARAVRMLSTALIDGGLSVYWWLRSR